MKRFFAAECASFVVSLVITFSLTIFMSAARAEIVAADSFDYSIETIRGCNGGEGWMDAWTGESFIIPGSFRYPGYDVKGNRLVTPGDSVKKSDVVKCSFRTLATMHASGLVMNGKFGKPGTQLWIGFLANLPDGPAERRGTFAGVSLLDDRREQMFFGKSSQKSVWGFERSGQLQTFGNVRADTNIVFLVYRMTFRPNDARVEMWVNPKPGTNDLSLTDVVTAEDLRPFRFNRVRICSAPILFGLDELRLGTTFADVAPQKR
jgi:hypothetical protein